MKLAEIGTHRCLWVAWASDPRYERCPGCGATRRAIVATPTPTPVVESETHATRESTKPRFTVGQKVMVNHESEMAYRTIARKGAVGEITSVLRLHWSIRRYAVRYAYGVIEHIREQHLLPVIGAMPDGRGIALRSVTPVYGGSSYVTFETPDKHAEPCYAVGQKVKIIANLGGLYAAQIGVVGTVSQQRPKRQGYHWYGVSYASASGAGTRAQRVVIVREDDLEPTADALTTQLTPNLQRALDEWKRRMGAVAHEPHYKVAVFPTRANAEAALRRGIDALVRLGVFRELPDHRIQLTTPVWPVEGES